MKHSDVILWILTMAALGSDGAETSSSHQQQGIHVIFVMEDGELIRVVNKHAIPHDGDAGLSSAAISSVFLLLIIMISFIANAVLVGTIASSVTLKRYV